MVIGSMFSVVEETVPYHAVIALNVFLALMTRVVQVRERFLDVLFLLGRVLGH